MRGMISLLLLFAGILGSPNLGVGAQSGLTTDYYDGSCPNLMSIVYPIVKNAISTESRMGASLLRLHFHDCFVLGCDASILLDDSATVTGEKSGPPNNMSVRGYDVIDNIKSQVEAACPNTVSCADITAIAARDAVRILGGPSWEVELGRRDSLSAGTLSDLRSLPPATFNLSQLTDTFANQNLSVTDMVALSGGHTTGQARCKNYRTHIYNETNIDNSFARSKQRICPLSDGDENLSAMDRSTRKFNNDYFKDLLKFRGLLHSDQELYSNGGGTTDSIVRNYAKSEKMFFRDFVSAMLKMGRIKPLTGTDGEIRRNCRKIN